MGFDKEPIRFKVTGKIDSPNLCIELNDELHFDVALGDLIQNQKVIKYDYVFYSFRTYFKLNFD